LKKRSLAVKTLGTWVALSIVANLYLGCSTTHVDSERISGRTAADAPASLAVAIYETVSAEHKKQPVAWPVSTRLVRNAAGTEEVVQESTSSTWSIDALSPGPYLLQIFGAAPADGSAPKVIEKEAVTLKAGRKATLVVILKDRRGAYWTAMGIGIAAVAVAVLVAALNSIDTSCNTSYKARAAREAQDRAHPPMPPARPARP
jgi:hypothetical protein